MVKANNPLRSLCHCQTQTNRSALIATKWKEPSRSFHFIKQKISYLRFDFIFFLLLSSDWSLETVLRPYQCIIIANKWPKVRWKANFVVSSSSSCLYSVDLDLLIFHFFLSFSLIHLFRSSIQEMNWWKFFSDRKFIKTSLNIKLNNFDFVSFSFFFFQTCRFDWLITTIEIVYRINDFYAFTFQIVQQANISNAFYIFVLSHLTMFANLNSNKTYLQSRKPTTTEYHQSRFIGVYW